MGIYLLFVFLLAVFGANVYLNNKCFGAPAVVFSFAFVLSSIWACAYAHKWKLDLHDNTFMVIFCSVLVFSIICLLTRNFDNIYKIDHSGIKKLESAIAVNDKKIIFFVIFEIITILYYIKTIRTMTGKASLPDAISAVYSNGNLVDFSFMMRQMMTLINAGGYWFSFIAANNYLANSRIPWLQIIPVINSVVLSSLNGSRGDGVCILLSMAAFMILIEYRKNKRHRRIKMKTVMLAVLIGGTAIWSFPRIGDLLGRKTSIAPLDYIAAYIGAEIKNLDIFLSGSKIPANSGTWGSQVFKALEQTLNKYFDFMVIKSSDLPGFNWVNGYFLGNVYTIFFDLLYDFGYVGNFIIISILAFVNQKIFDCAEKKAVKGNIPIIIILYGYMFPLILFSFFAWWFGNYVISTGFLYKVFYWKFLNIFFFKVKMFPKIRMMYK